MAQKKYLDLNGLEYYTEQIKDAIGEATGVTTVDPVSPVDTTDIVIPTKTSQLENDSGFLTNASIDNKQDKLVSGTNIKTINNQSVLGEGNISINTGTTNYNDLSNKPQIGGVTLSGNKTLAQLGINIPDSISDLTNDSGFITGITSSDVTTALGYTPYNATNPNGYISSYTETDPVFKASAAYGIKSTDITNWNNKTSNTGTITEIKVNNTSIATSGAANITVPTNNNQLTNGAGYQTASQVNSLIATAIGDITGISYEVVNSLPATGEAGVIYLISNSGTSPNIYDEYIYVNNKFEKIGTTEVDLSNYSTTAQVQSMIQTAIGNALEASY